VRAHYDRAHGSRARADGMTATAAPRAAARARAARPAWVAVLALWAAGAAISGFTVRRYLVPLDEGVLLQAVTRIGAGQWPWRDFGWAYGPAEPVLLAGAAKLLGPSVIWWRLLRVAADATAALAVWALARDGAGERTALAAWLAAAVIAAQPTSASPTAAALALALAAVWLAARRPAWACVAAGAAAAFRPDFGGCAIAAAALTAVVAGLGGPAGAGTRRGLRGGLVALAAGLGTGAVLYAPFAVAAGPGRLWDALVVASARDGAWWRLPFPAGYAGDLDPWPPGTLLADLKDLGQWLAPYAALAGLVLAAVVLARRGRRRPPAAAGLLVLALGAAAYLRSRADLEHAQPLLVVTCALVPLAAARAARPVAVALAAVLALLLAVGAGNRLSALLRPPRLAALHLPGVPGIGVPPGEARALPRLVADVQRRVSPGEPVYVAPRRSDVVTRTDPLLHFLVRRPNVLRDDVSLQARPAEQARIVAALRRARPRVVIRWTDPVSSAPEPNRRGRPSGSRSLDAYLAAAYRPAARYGAYVVLVPRRPGRE
jgi:hypothetical protein